MKERRKLEKKKIVLRGGARGLPQSWGLSEETDLSYLYINVDEGKWTDRHDWTELMD